jgi:uncharacterized membrane protein (UPF0127 family)
MGGKHVNNMLVVNKKKRILIPILIKRADTFKQRFFGLMFRRIPISNEGLWIIPCDSIHMFFMSFPIDVLFLDKQGYIVKLTMGIKPWKVIPPVPNAFSVIELPIGTIKKYEIELGDKVIVET